MNFLYRYLFILFSLYSFLFANDPAVHKTPNQNYSFVKGITISTHRGGREWGTDVIIPTLDSIKKTGANWVTTHPYAGISKDGSIHFRYDNSVQPPAHWVRPIEEAHAAGLKICIKPHLAHWRSGFSWRGDINFTTEEEWSRFWKDYKTWIVRVAAACKDADGFVVGTELDKTVRFENKWREIIAAVREVTDVPLTYAANWTDYQQVPFWDALDIIGIQAYFPLAETENPTEADIRSGWEKWTEGMRVFAKKMNRKILFTELGYSQSQLAAKEPWLGRRDGQAANHLQEMCWRVALETIENEPEIVGAMLWKWFPSPRPTGRNFRLATPRIINLLSEYWLNKN